MDLVSQLDLSCVIVGVRKRYQYNNIVRPLFLTFYLVSILLQFLWGVVYLTALNYLDSNVNFNPLSFFNNSFTIRVKYYYLRLCAKNTSIFLYIFTKLYYFYSSFF